MSQFVESKIRRDGDGKFANKGASAEASDVQLTHPEPASEPEHLTFAGEKYPPIKVDGSSRRAG